MIHNGYRICKIVNRNFDMLLIPKLSLVSGSWSSIHISLLDGCPQTYIMKKSKPVEHYISAGTCTRHAKHSVCDMVTRCGRGWADSSLQTVCRVTNLEQVNAYLTIQFLIVLSTDFLAELCIILSLVNLRLKSDVKSTLLFLLVNTSDVCWWWWVFPLCRGVGDDEAGDAMASQLFHQNGCDSIMFSGALTYTYKLCVRH